MIKALSFGIVIGVTALACGGSTPPAAAPSSAAPAPTASKIETPEQAANSGSINISPDILKACGISESDAFFAFDSAKLQGQNIKPLNDVATCFTSGPMKGHGLRLVGRADPRGASDYNMTLGQSRSDSVQKYLMDKGVDKSKVESTSRGAMDATGADEAGWSKDRRVDVLMGN